MMSFYLKNQAGTTVAVGAAMLGFGTIAIAGDRAPIATPFGITMPQYEDVGTGSWNSVRGGVVDLQAAADHIVNLQCDMGNNMGGWDWPHDGLCIAPPNNITAPIAGGLLRAYPATQDPAHLAAAVAGGEYDRISFVYPNNNTPRFSSMTAWFMNELTNATGNLIYAEHARDNFYGALANGTYGDTGNTMDTAGWIALVQAARAGMWINLLPWEFATNVAAAQDLGNPAQVDLFIEAILDGLDTLDNSDPANVYSDIIGLTGGVRGLAFGGVDTFTPITSPNHSLINGVTTLTDLAGVLVNLQNPDGSWYWHSNLGIYFEADKDTQTTAYAVLALIEAQNAGAGDYTDQIARGRQWLGSMQDGDGGFPVWPGGTYNTTVEAEALTALASSSSLSLNTTLCENSGTLTVTIDMSDTAVDIVGGQFFLSYDQSVLTFLSADVASGGTFSTEVYEFVGAGTIDYAVGVTPGGAGTNAGETMAVLTFDVPAENCTAVESLVAFRNSVPPSRLTDDLGNPVLPLLVDLNAVAFDETAPSVTPPTDITQNADAGGCDAWVAVPALDVSDNCGIATIVNSITGTDDASGTYPEGTTTVTWTVTDTCGNVTVVTQNITVNSSNSLSVTVELANVTADLTRCITFELTPTGGGAPVIIEQDLTFAGGTATATFDIPCGDYDCITARDTLHTLRSRDDDDFGISGTIYSANFTSAGDGDALIGGNLNDDMFIDILDFGIFIGQFGTTLGADTICGTAAPHADVDGDGNVGTTDYTFISTQFLFESEEACPSTLMAGGNGITQIDAQRADEPVVSITIEQLEARGLGHLASADLNGDGVLDQADIAAFYTGARPDYLADVNHDGVVDLEDLRFMKQAMTAGDMAGDVNHDGRLDLADLIFVLERLGMTFEN